MNEHPESITKVKATQMVALIFMFVATIIIDAFALYMVSGVITGNYEHYYGMLISSIIVSLFGGILTIAFPILLIKKFREPSVQLYLPEPRSEFGETFKGHIIISMAVNQTPPVVATLKLTRSQSDFSAEFTGGGRVVWKKEVIIDKFKPTGAKQCRGEFEILLRNKALTDFRGTGDLRWQLFVRSGDPKRTFGEVFDVPVIF